MRYIVGDIHGCYREYQQLLERIHLTDEDELYVLGDAIDRGPEPIRVMQDLMCRFNAIYIAGNHDIAFYLLMKQMNVEITEENAETQLSSEWIERWSAWVSDGGAVTAEQFHRLSAGQKEDLLDYIEDALPYGVLTQGEKTYILVHGDLGNFSEEKALDEYTLAELVEDRADYSRRYYNDPDIYLVTGHTPNLDIPGWERMEVYQQNGHIALDMGCASSGILAAYCVETGNVIYSDGKDRSHMV